MRQGDSDLVCLFSWRFITVISILAALARASISCGCRPIHAPMAARQAAVLHSVPVPKTKFGIIWTEVIMGMYVSRLRSVPVGLYEYYTYLVDTSAAQAHTGAIDHFFDAFAKQSGVDAVIVRGPEDLSWELFKFLQVHAPADLGRLESMFHEATCLVVSEGALQTTEKPIYVLPLMLPHAQEPEQSELVDALLASLLNALKAHQLGEFVVSLGAERIQLANINGGMFVATLRHANEMLELKPNIAGMGLNLNAVIQKALGPPQRQLPA